MQWSVFSPKSCMKEKQRRRKKGINSREILRCKWLNCSQRILSLSAGVTLDFKVGQDLENRKGLSA